ncbi:MAG: hypothetical protein ACOCXP_01730 [Candidatus Dojkabacteria bacterium]
MVSDKPGRKQLKIGNNKELQELLEKYASEINRPASTAARMLIAKSLNEYYFASTKEDKASTSQEQDQESVITLGDILTEKSQAEAEADPAVSSSSNASNINASSSYVKSDNARSSNGQGSANRGVSIVIHNYN